MKNKKIIFSGVAAGFVLVLLVSALIAASFTGVFTRVPRPEIKEGEFDFALTYELDGETKKIEGTYLCKFEGTSRALDGVGRDWKGYIKDHSDSTDYEIKTTDEGVIKVELDLDPEFFMSDPHYKSNINLDERKPEPYLFITPTEYDVNESKLNYYDGDDVKIISFEYDAPIENTYKIDVFN